LKPLETVRGKFLLSSCRNEALKEFAGHNGWHTVELKMALSMTHGHKIKRRKVEALATGYPVAVRLDGRCRVKKELVSGDGEAAES
jgi:hypothetical protein